MSHTKGNWKIGRPGTVVSDTVPENWPNNSGHDDTGYYGGFLLAESVPTIHDAKLMSAAPDMLEALLSIENDSNQIPAAIWEMRNKAIKKATE